MIKSHMKYDDTTLMSLFETFCQNGLSEQEKELIKGYKADSKEIPETFSEIAKCILCGCFIVTNGLEEVKIAPTTVEFYYHEEDDYGIKDEIVYHKNTFRKDNRPFFKIGFLNSHDSGIDITFESQERNFRASALIREFEVINGHSNDVLELKKGRDDRSTYFRKALLSQFSIFDGFRVSWIDWCKNPDEWEISKDTRKGVEVFAKAHNVMDQAKRPWKCSLSPKNSNI